MSLTLLSVLLTIRGIGCVCVVFSGLCRQASLCQSLVATGIGNLSRNRTAAELADSRANSGYSYLTKRALGMSDTP